MHTPYSPWIAHPAPLATPAVAGQPPADPLAEDLDRLMRASRAYLDSEPAAAERAAERNEHARMAAQLGHALFPHSRTPLAGAPPKAAPEPDVAAMSAELARQLFPRRRPTRSRSAAGPAAAEVLKRSWGAPGPDMAETSGATLRLPSGPFVGTEDLSHCRAWTPPVSFPPDPVFDRFRSNLRPWEGSVANRVVGDRGRGGITNQEISTRFYEALKIEKPVYFRGPNALPADVLDLTDEQIT